MPFLGNQPQQGFANSVVKDDFTPNGSTTAFTLSKSAASANDIEVYVGNVRQEPTDAYSVSGTTLTMSKAPASGLNFYVLHVQGTVESTIAPQSNSVGTGIIQNSAVTTAKIADANITTAKLVGETVIQVKSAVDTAARSTTSQTFVVGSNTAQVTITPRSASSRFIIYCTGVISTDDGNDGTFTTIFRDSTNLGQQYTGLAFGNSVPTVSVTYHPFSMTILDSPSTASAITYGLRFRSYNFDSDGSTTSRLGNHLGGTSNSVPTHITVMELAG